MPRQLLARIRSIEQRMGRRRTHVNIKGPRLIDLDILLFGRAIVDLPDWSFLIPRCTSAALSLNRLWRSRPTCATPCSKEPCASCGTTCLPDRRPGECSPGINQHSAALDSRQPPFSPRIVCSRADGWCFMRAAFCVLVFGISLSVVAASAQRGGGGMHAGGGGFHGSTGGFNGGAVGARMAAGGVAGARVVSALDLADLAALEPFPDSTVAPGFEP